MLIPRGGLKSPPPSLLQRLGPVAASMRQASPVRTQTVSRDATEPLEEGEERSPGRKARKPRGGRGRKRGDRDREKGNWDSFVPADEDRDEYLSGDDGMGGRRMFEPRRGEPTHSLNTCLPFSLCGNNTATWCYPPTSSRLSDSYLIQINLQTVPNPVLPAYVRGAYPPNLNPAPTLHCKIQPPHPRGRARGRSTLATQMHTSLLGLLLALVLVPSHDHRYGLKIRHLTPTVDLEVAPDPARPSLGDPALGRPLPSSDASASENHGPSVIART